MAEKGKLTFEQSMKRLEEIVRQLEQGDAPLEESLKLLKDSIIISKEYREPDPMVYGVIF